MADEEPARPLPKILREGNVSFDRSKSRLIRRGLLALDAKRTVSLNVLNLVASGESVFILAEDWDASVGECTDDSRVSVSRLPRIVLWEFSRSGEYIHRLVLPLVELSREGYLRVADRRLGLIRVRPEFIHFFEEVELRDADSAERIDYLFSWEGKRIAVWAYGPFVNRYRSPGEPPIPLWVDGIPDAITGDSLVTVRPMTANLTDPYDESYMPFLGATTTFCVEARGIDHFLLSKFGQDVADGARQDVYAEIVDYPVPAVLLDGGRFITPWKRPAEYESGLWYMNYEFLWRLSELVGDVQIDTFELPKVSWIHFEEFGEPEDAEWNWGVMGRRIALGTDPSYFEFEFTSMLVDENDVVIFTVVRDLEGRFVDSMPMLLRMESGDLWPVGRLDPGAMFLRALDSRWMELSEDNQMDTGDWKTDVWSLYTSHPVSGSLQHVHINDGVLYSVCRSEAHRSAIVMTDINSETITWFQPEVPESELPSNDTQLHRSQ